VFVKRVTHAQPDVGGTKGAKGAHPAQRPGTPQATRTVRATLSIDTRDCIGCDVCVAHCERGVLRMIDGKALVDLRNLNQCDLDGECVDVCPTRVVRLLVEPMETDHSAQRHRPPPGHPIAGGNDLAELTDEEEASLGTPAEEGVARRAPIDSVAPPPTPLTSPPAVTGRRPGGRVSLPILRA
jgi:ferredoxin